MDEYESVILVKPEVYVYQIPPRTSNRGYKYGSLGEGWQWVRTCAAIDQIQEHGFVVWFGLDISLLERSCHRASEWNLEKWLWEGRMRVLAQGKTVTVRLEDKSTGMSR